ncbi:MULTISPECIES: ParB/RepB/Spo0J family partition protein [unclassified Sphingomonas]|uniref:ParB/RepB/Spo0J family partition protein n=1 Tax=unclassified Sphingomonas TaxID=196159 RepID=UPI0006F53DFD|nr:MULTISPECIES: ParB/RepB/Spo0J family partition protein [unclassified Sphingomonas]KQX19169.1 chromosome partitioning protein ParB [Sphingomonas sp. Root1294]KQY65370.1 chromosome partitioning protein ParB [Sphingomonas sp. Root50]KRB95335.1 chromosome partitioning protein ParB [Sphingomonas sp. Root720]
MKLEFIALDKLVISTANMRGGKKPPDVSDLLPTVRARGVLQPIIVRPNCAPDGYEILAGRRRFFAASLVAQESGQSEPMPCAILEAGDDAAAIEASMIENMARLDPDEVTRWVSFTRLVKEGRGVEDIATTFGLPDLAVRRILALGNLLPRIRDLYAQEQIDRATVRHLTMASKAQQKTWLSLRDDAQAYAPIGHQLKAWLFGGQSIAVKQALFDIVSYPGQIVADLFGEDGYFADADTFWTAQQAVIDARRDAYLEAGWSDVVIVPTTEHFHEWEYEKTAKRKGGRVYIDLCANGEVTFHEGYLSRKEAQKAARAEAIGTGTKVARPEVTSTMQTYIDLHRHAAVRAALIGHPAVALRLMVAHAIAGSHLWRVSIEPQSSRNEAVRESVETSTGEADFDAARRRMLDLLGFDPDQPTLIDGRIVRDDDGPTGDGLSAIFLALLDLTDAQILGIVAVAMGETLASGSPAVEAVGATIGVTMSAYWQADDALFDLIRDKEVLDRIVAEVAGETIAKANVGEKTKVLKKIVRDHLDGAEGRTKVEHWVPRWMAFPPSAYTERGGVGTVRAAAMVEAARAIPPAPDPDAPPGAVAATEPQALAA